MKTIAHTILNLEELSAFSLQLETDRDVLPSVLINLLLEVPASATEQEKEINGTQTEKEEIKTFDSQMM